MELIQQMRLMLPRSMGINTDTALQSNSALFARMFGGFAIRRILYFLFSDYKS